MLADPVRDGIFAAHRHLGQFHGKAARYRRDVVPFATISESTPAALADLLTLLEGPEDHVWLFATNLPAIPGLSNEGSLECLQMHLPEGTPLPEPATPVTPLTEADAPDMVALTDLAFPGFFRPRTYEMGAYFGIRENGQLIAMGGERLRPDGMTELSAVCTNPAHRARGFATSLILHLARHHRSQGRRSFLHVGAANTSAIRLYQSLGFVATAQPTITRLAPTGSPPTP